MQVSTTDYASSYWFKQDRDKQATSLGVGGAVELPNAHLPPEAAFPFFNPSSLKFHP